MSQPLRLLIVDDSQEDALALLRPFAESGYRVQTRRVSDADGLFKALARQDWDAVLCEHRLAAMEPGQAAEVVGESGLDLPLIIVSQQLAEHEVVAAMRSGAHDVISRARPDHLVAAVEREVRESRARRAHRQTLAALKESEERFQAVSTNIPDIVFQLATGTASEGDFEFRFVSDAARTMLGLDPQVLLEAPAHFLTSILAEDRRAFRQSLTRAIRREASWQWEGRMQAQYEDGVRWVNLRAMPRHQSDDSLLWDGIVTDITPSRLAAEQLAELSSHLQSAKETERMRIAREVHDEIGSMLVAINMEMTVLQNRLNAANPELADRGRSICGLLNQTIDTVSRVVRALRPGILEEFGLAAAIECQAEDFAARTGLRCRVDAIDDGGVGLLTDDAVLAVFRICQEALNNVGKHARAKEVAVEFTADAESLELIVRDDGCGFDPDDINKTGSFGLRGIRERARGLGGRISIDSRPGEGTCISLRLPLSAPAKPASRRAQNRKAIA